MRTKDLKVGEEYAFGAPNSYDAERPHRVWVVRTGVYGPAPRGGFYRTRSTHANFVEFEAGGDSYVNAYQFSVPLNASDEIPTRHSGDEVVRHVLRGPAQFFLKPWAEHVEAAQAAQAADKRAKKRKREQTDHRDGVAAKFRALGFYVSDYDRNIQLSVEDAEKLLGMIK